MSHHQFLPLDHIWHNQTAQFDGKKEKRAAPKRLIKDDILKQLHPLGWLHNFWQGKKLRSKILLDLVKAITERCIKFFLNCHIGRCSYDYIT